MTRAEPRPRVLAIGIDAAEATLVRRLIADGAMPALAGLVQRGRWSRVESPASVGSGSVWPTFFTGAAPRSHGVYSEWLWDPGAMTVVPYDPSRLVPFWSRLIKRNLRVGLLDVPFAPFLDVAEGFDVSEWGAHDVLEGRTRAAPAGVAALLASAEPHPFGHGVRATQAGHGVRATQAGARPEDVGRAAQRGIGQRGALAARLLSDADPDLAIVVFTEIHHASHVLWHTLSSEDPPPPGPSLIDLYATVDREIARLVEVVGSDGSVVVFALHGMRATRGIPTLLPGLLRGEGYAQPATWSTQSWPERALSAFGAAKRRSPAWARALYNAGVGHSLRVGLARPTMLDPLDWPRTRAFSLPTDQHGWLRVNLQGRERRGTVSGGEYGSLCDRLEARLRALSTADGRPIVAEVLRTATDGRDAVGNPLPDMVVHWATAAHDDPSQVSNVNLTGQHGSDGFCVTVGPVAAAMADTVKAEDLHAALLSPRLA